MKEFLISLAEYNDAADKKVLEILAPLSDEALGKDLGVFYRSIAGTIEHIVMSHLLYLKRFNSFFSYPCLKESELLQADPEKIKISMQNGARNRSDLMRRVDELYLRFTRELAETDLSKKVRYKTIKGDDMEKTYWKTIFHVLNHATHHRGEISAMLDILKISNDFAGFTQYST